MRLVVDASTLIAEVLRARGRKLLEHPDLDLLIASEAWDETKHELRKRTALVARRWTLSETRATELLEEALAVITSCVNLVSPETYTGRLVESQQRVPRDSRDIPSVALALAFDCGIWTGDYDFFGDGLPVWTTETLQLHLKGLRELDETRESVEAHARKDVDEKDA